MSPDVLREFFALIDKFDGLAVRLADIDHAAAVAYDNAGAWLRVLVESHDPRASMPTTAFDAPEALLRSRAA